MRSHIKIKAISINEDNAAKIDDEKCIQCGACVYQCPFGAITDRSFIINVMHSQRQNGFYRSLCGKEG